MRERRHEVIRYDAVTQATRSYLEMLGILPLMTIVPKEEEN